jgi:antitoxin StbD
MTNFNPAFGQMLSNMIPINRFNRGEASKIFSEVEESGVKVVLKNNAPVGIILTPKMYEAMIAEIEDMALLLEAKDRMLSAKGQKTIPHDVLKQELGILDSELDDIEDVEIE